MLFATTAITGPNGEQVDRDQPIPTSWPVDSEFVQEGIEQGWLVSGDEAPTPLLPAVPPSSANVGGNANREGTGTA